MITISLGKAMNFNAQLTSYIDGFTSTGFPYFVEDDQMIVTGTVAGKNTQMFVLDGSNLKYEFSSHTVSGDLDTVTLGTLGNSYNTDGSFDLDGQGHITGHTSAITFDGLDLHNPAGVRGVVHEIVAELMYLGGMSDRGAATFLGVVWGEAHDLHGSTGNDTYTGTRFGDRVAGDAGNDSLAGADGHDTINGGAGNDTVLGGNGNDRIVGDAGADRLFGDAGNDQITGGAGKDTMTGGTGKDTFVFSSTADSPNNARDTIADFASNDVLQLTAIDANTARAGNQAFTIVDKLDGHAGQLSLFSNASGTTVFGDTDGDGAADIAIVLSGYLKFQTDDVLL